jgi:AraC-like DNA-binding protein
LLVTGRGQFRARLTQVRLDGWRLAAVEEEQARIAFVAVPAGTIIVSFPVAEGPSPVWGGIEVQTGEILTLGPGQRVHAKTLGSSHWGAIQVPDQQLDQYGRALNGARFIVPAVARWRPPSAAARQLRSLHRAAIRMAEARAGALTDLQAAHGLEQQLLHALIECLAQGAEEERASGRRHRDILARFEDLLVAEPSAGTAEICAALGVSQRSLRECCKEHLGMGPSRYRYLCAMQQVRCALRSASSDTTKVSGVAARYGFRGLGRFATRYRALYGELPSATLRRASNPGVVELALGRRRIKLS